MLGIRSYTMLVVQQYGFYMLGDQLQNAVEWYLHVKCICGHVYIKIKRGPPSVCALIAKVYTHECCWCTAHIHTPTARQACTLYVDCSSHSRRPHMPRETQIFNTSAEQMP